MKLTEKIFAVAVVAGLLLTFSLIRGGPELFIISLLGLAGIYFALGFLLFNRIRLRDLTKKGLFENLTTIRIVFAVITGIALSIICVGALFKLMNLPGANEMLMFGVIITLLVSITAIVMRNKILVIPILIRTVVIGVAGSFLFFTPSLSIIKLQYRNHPAYIEAYTRYTEDPKNELLWEKSQLEYHRVWMSEEDFKEYEQSP